MTRARIVVSLLLLGSTLAAQRYSFSIYGQEEGLVNLGVQCMLQDKTGYLWIGTQNGLFRYDGSRFRAYGLAEGLPSARITAVHESPDGVLWVGSMSGLARREGDRFIPVQAAQPLTILGRAALASDQRGRIYLGTERGLVVGEPDGVARLRFRSYAVPGAKEALVPSVLPEAGDTLWFGCGKAICRMQNDKVSIHGPAEGVVEDRWFDMIRDREGTLWARGYSHLLSLPSGAKRFVESRLEGDINGLFNGARPSLAVDHAGRLLVPGAHGLSVRDRSGWRSLTASHGFPLAPISFAFQDREGSVWLGLLGAGLARWLGYGAWESWTSTEGLAHDVIWSIRRDPLGQVWAGTQTGLSVLGNGERAWKIVEGIPRTSIRGLAVHGGKLWVANDPGGLFAVDLQTKAVTAYGAESGWDGRGALALVVDRVNTLWVGARWGVYRSTTLDRWPIRFEKQPMPQTDPEEVIFSAVMDKQGALWFSGRRGLARYDGGSWSRFTTRDGLRHDFVAYLGAGPDGSVWLAYREPYGLSRAFLRHGKLDLEYFGQDRGLRSGKVLFVGFDPRGWLWAGTDQGVDVLYDSDSNAGPDSWRHYVRQDGLVWNDCDANAFFADPDGSVWLGTSRGLSHFQPGNVPPSPEAPGAVIAGLKSGDSSRDPQSDLQLPAGNVPLVVSFTALTYVNEPSILFRYRLSGVDLDWVETRAREARYPHLDAGRYTFEVIARSPSGVWSRDAARVTFEAVPAWWATWWARTLAVVAFLLAAVQLWSRRLEHLRNEHRRLERAVAERTAELALEKNRAEQEKTRVQIQKGEIQRLLEEAQKANAVKSQFLANMSHEIRTPMNGIVGMTDLVLATRLDPEQREFLEIARMSADNLLELLNDILDFSKIESGRMELEVIPFSLRGIVAEAVKTSASRALQKGLRLRTQIQDGMPDSLMGDPVRLRQILLNLLGNAIKFTERGSVTVEVRSRLEAGTADTHFLVRDTGIGIPPEKQTLVFDAFRQADGSMTRKYGGSGLGLAICSRLVALMRGSLWVESEPGKGSCFQFRVPFELGPALPCLETSRADAAASLRELDRAVTERSPAELSVLVVEDNRVNQQLAARILEKRGYRVSLAGNGLVALEMTGARSFDVVLMDLQMPELDGLETTRRLREREEGSGRHMPILAMTAHANRGDRERCLAAGMDGYVSKPIQFQELYAAIDDVLEGAGKSEAVEQ